MFNSQTATRAKQILLATVLSIGLAVTIVSSAIQFQVATAIDNPVNAILTEGPAEGIEIASGGSQGMNGGG